MGAVDNKVHRSPAGDSQTQNFHSAAVQSNYEIGPARIPEHLEIVRTLFREYAASIGVDIAYQGFEDELAHLPGKYAAPAGRLLIAWQDGIALGCVALRPLTNNDCEMKRLYVRPAARGLSLGQALAVRICEEARGAGYSRICLD